MIERPDVLCIQETWPKPQLDFIIKGYIAVRRDRKSGRGGGVATFIQNGMRYKIIQVRVWTDKGSIDIVSYYNPM